MCMVDYADEPIEDLSCHQPKARKVHLCEECQREIHPGEHYEKLVGKFEGYLVTYKTCLQCVAVRTWLSHVCSGWIYGSVGEDLYEHFREGYGIWLARAYVGIRNKWKRRDGALRPPMKLPEQLPTG